MSNVLSEEKKQQVIALGKLGWPLRRIEQETGVRRETAGAYLKAAGISVSRPGWRGRAGSKPAIQVATDSGDSKPANAEGVTTDFIRPFPEKSAIQLPAPKLSTSDCEPFREVIELGLSRGRNPMAIWQDMVTDHGFSGAYNTVKRFVRKLRGAKQPERYCAQLHSSAIFPAECTESCPLGVSFVEVSQDRFIGWNSTINVTRSFCQDS
jgi:hypothetical protein